MTGAGSSQYFCCSKDTDRNARFEKKKKEFPPNDEGVSFLNGVEKVERMATS